MRTARLYWMDLIRILAIYGVIFIHIYDLPSQWTWPQDALGWLFLILAKTSVPLFFMVSGGLLLPKREANRVFFQKRLSKVIIPWLLMVIVVITTSLYSKPSVFNDPSSFKYLIEQIAVSHYWFIPVLGSLYLITPLLRTHITHLTSGDFKYGLTLWLLLLFTPYLQPTAAVPLPINLSLITQTSYYLGYYLAGYALLRHDVLPFPAWGCILSGLLFQFGYTVWRPGMISTPDYEVTFNYLAPGIALLALGIFHLIHREGKQLGQHLPPQILNVMVITSQATLWIYLIHAYVTAFLMSYWTSIAAMLPIPVIRPIVNGLYALIVLSLTTAGIIGMSKLVGLFKRV